ncbi:hypothetical protein N657DRAFT_709198 [Parathielavia appendiculata]|uniref:GED domain-containing protein n=1 Tax=Parathielavia appendiculata TaxID=2587402 RepID=A0AAN6Z621_9PEZI|nr:hypothetical protein N657DRAFT_709198 [Parathielavia appendiculata]
MSDAQLGMIAGEDATTKRQKERLGSEIQGLEATTKVLRGLKEVRYALVPLIGRESDTEYHLVHLVEMRKRCRVAVGFDGNGRERKSTFRSTLLRLCRRLFLLALAFLYPLYLRLYLDFLFLFLIFLIFFQ